jgi:hypothetical protein
MTQRTWMMLDPAAEAISPDHTSELISSHKQLP